MVSWSNITSWIDIYLKHVSLEKIEYETTVCALNVWVIVLAFCWLVLTSESIVNDFESAIAYLAMWPFVKVIFIISICKTGKAILNLYKYRNKT